MKLVIDYNVVSLFTFWIYIQMISEKEVGLKRSLSKIDNRLLCDN